MRLIFTVLTLLVVTSACFARAPQKPLPPQAPPMAEEPISADKAPALCPCEKCPSGRIRISRDETQAWCVCGCEMEVKNFRGQKIPARCPCDKCDCPAAGPSGKQCCCTGERKARPCSAQCTCGCNESGFCSCGEPRRAVSVEVLPLQATPLPVVPAFVPALTHAQSAPKVEYVQYKPFAQPERTIRYERYVTHPVPSYYPAPTHYQPPAVAYVQPVIRPAVYVQPQAAYSPRRGQAVQQCGPGGCR